ncbi:zinc finger and SCAN domain-containing protein 2-like isoform X1 [Entelurus aequoreus]|uniref:zinc finger and SCAN domain-containing protein 2-like isoform X1 n=1 Tax=Entelurus aequoreus TaxID=161455 RepID=UPI002B1D3D97|nr:zinc finger and SCAN domain-containing protein 2-like isoform X1 [Entelurus aequoreus]
MLNELVKKRLAAAADEICGLFERTIASYAEELSRTRKENERRRQQLEEICKTHIVIHVEDLQQLIGRQDELPLLPQQGRSTLKQEDPQPTFVKEEEELWITQDGERLLVPEEEEEDFEKSPLTSISVKTENHEDKPPESSQRHHSPSEENKGAEPSSSSSPQHITTEDDEDHCGGSHLSNSDGTTSYSPKDGDAAKEPLSSDTDCKGDMRTQTDNKHSEKQMGKNQGVLGNVHRRTHTRKKPFSCSVCGKRLTDRSAVASHMTTHTGEKPFSCSVCGKKISHKSTMVTHMRIHTGETPYSCSVCWKSFYKKSSVIRHMRTHTGEKPFSCSWCGERFSVKSNMVQHLRTHTGEKPFSCSICGIRFSQKSNMIRHMARAHKTL